MNDKTLDLLQKLAEKFNTTADHLWQVMTHQAMIQFWINISIYVIGFLLIYPLIRKLLRKTDLNNSEIDGAFALLILVGLAAFFYVLFVATSLGETITCITNPEYWALKHILR